MIQIPEGYRQTAFKSRHDNLTTEKVADFEARGEKVMVKRIGMYNYIFVKIEKPLGGHVNEVVETMETEKEPSDGVAQKVSGRKGKSETED